MIRRTQVETLSVEAVLERTRLLVAECRAQCLWYLREDFAPSSVEEALRALRAIEQHGNRDAYVKARQLRQWLLQTCKEPSAV